MVIEELFTRLGFQVDPKGIDKARNALTGFKKFVGGLALGAGFVALAKTGIEAAMTMEGLTAQFTVMTGSAEKAKNVIGEIADFAEKTPFDKLGLSNAAKTLMAFGTSSEKILPTLKMLGDVAGADQNRLNSLALVFGQIQSAGRLMGQDLLQLINQGFNPLTIISQKTGRSMALLKKDMEQGKISADMVTLAFKAATSEGGLFFGNLEAQSKTLQGRLSTLRDNFVTALQRMAEAFLPMMKAGVDMLIAFDWTPIISAVQSFGNALSSIPFDTVTTWARRLMIVVASLSVNHLQKMLLPAFMNVAKAGTSAFKGLTLSFTSFRNLTVAGAKSIGLAMKTALGPIGIALMAIEGFVEAYNWLENRNRKKATESQKRYARQYISQAISDSHSTKTREEVVADVVDQQEYRKRRAETLREQAAAGGESGKRASRELDKVIADINQHESFVHAMREVYKEMTGMEWATKTGVARTPSMTGDTKNLEAAFAKIEQSLNQMTSATKKQTKATEDNTRAQRSFDISTLSRQAFDAAFNVKLREVTLGAL